MGKTFITDEVNDNYTANVTNAGKLQVEDAGNLFYTHPSGRAEDAASAITEPCYLKSVTFGAGPATASYVTLYDCSSSGGIGTASGCSSFFITDANTSTHIIGHFKLEFSGGAESGAGAVAAFPVTIPLNVYCSSGVTIGMGQGFAHCDDLSGAVKGITLVYQT